MRRLIFTWLGIATVSAASLSGDTGVAAPQNDSPSTATKTARQSCVDLWVSVEREKPFIAERKTITVQQDEVRIQQEADLVARDATGRIREEFHGPYKEVVPFEQIALGGLPSSRRDLNLKGAAQFGVTILDCCGGTRIFLSPHAEYAVVQKLHLERRTLHRNHGLYSDSVIKANAQPDAIVEDLGNQLVERIQARGTKITSLGGNQDGDWKGKPVRVLEVWVSDELGATLAWKSSDLIRETTNIAFLKGIRREEPDASLFAVPSGYQIHSQEMAP